MKGKIMNSNKVKAATKLWLAAQERRAQAVTGEDAFWASRDIETKALPAMREAYASPEDVVGSTTPQITAAAAAPGKTPAVAAIDEEDEDENDASRKKFDYYCVPASPAMFALVDTVWTTWCAYQRLFSRQGEANDKLQLSACLSNIVNAELSDPDSEGVMITRRRGVLSLQSRYRPQIFTVRFLLIMDGLIGCGLLLQTKGTAWHGNVRPLHGRQTVIHSSMALRVLMAAHHVTDVHDTTWDRTGQEIILRKKDKYSALDEYSSLDVMANGYRADMQQINEMLRFANIVVLNRPGTPFIDVRDRFLQRQFTYQSWTSGGRLRGGFWMSLGKDVRTNQIQLNGEATVELDYNSIGYHALYAQAKAVLPAGLDVYDIPEMERSSRAGIKKLMLALTFDKKANRKSFPKGSSHLFSEVDRAIGAPVAIARIKKHHAAIGHLLGADKGHGLQFTESQVLVAVLLKVKSEGLIGLPIHDCLLVPVSQADRIKEIMEQVSMRVAGISVPVKRQ